MEKENFKNLSTKELQPLQEFWINRYVAIMLFISNPIQTIKSGWRGLYEKIEPLLIVFGVIIVLFCEAIINTNFFKKIKKFFVRFLITEQEYTKFNSP